PVRVRPPWFFYILAILRQAHETKRNYPVQAVYYSQKEKQGAARQNTISIALERSSHHVVCDCSCCDSLCRPLSDPGRARILSAPTGRIRLSLILLLSFFSAAALALPAPGRYFFNAPVYNTKESAARPCRPAL